MQEAEDACFQAYTLAPTNSDVLAHVCVPTWEMEKKKFERNKDESGGKREMKDGYGKKEMEEDEESTHFCVFFY